MRADGVTGGTAAVQVARGGSIPASALSFCIGREDDAKELVMRFHYSRRWPVNVQFVGSLHRPGGLFGDCGEAVAAAVFTVPGTRWSERVMELARLVRGSQQVPLSLLIRLSCSGLRRRGEDLLVSFADEQQGHKGGVYRACSWNYGGARDAAMDGLIVGGQFVPGRTCNNVWGTRSPALLKERHGIDAEPHYDEGKHLFWKALSKAGEEKAGRLGLKKL